ncbi:sugar phosphate isomerase/epimerase [Phycisphaeraceae bacterium D3-23]
MPLGPVGSVRYKGYGITGDPGGRPIPRFAICNETYGELPLDAALKDIADAGYDGVELAPFTLSDDPRNLSLEDAQELGELVRSHGLAVVGLHWLLAQTEGLHLTSPDVEVRRHTADYVGHLAELCGAMGGEVLVWGSPQQRSFSPDENIEHVMRRAVEVLREVCDFAGRCGVTVAVEPLGPGETNFLNTAAQTIELIERVRHPNCRLHLDVKAMASETKPIIDIIRDSQAYTAHFHANDPNLRGPGQGEVDFATVAKALEATGYDGWVSVEVFDYTPDAPTIARQSMQVLRESFSGAKQEQM